MAKLDKKRIFFAFRLPSGIKAEVQAAINSLSPQIGRVNWVQAESAHMTLLFLGEIFVEDLEEIDEAARYLGKEYSAADFRLKGLSAFPSSKQPRVLILDCEQISGKPMDGLNRELRQELASRHSLETENKAWHPHITIGRNKQPDNALPFVEVKALDFRVDGFVMMESFLTPGGAEYEVVKEYALK